jgi:hypothetical protein
MALVVKDRVQETSTTTGTGSLTLSGAVTGFQTFSSAIGNTNTTYYTIQNGSEWEVGIGTVSAGALSRDTVLESSNSGSLVNFSAGIKYVFCTYPAEKSVDIETAQTLTNKTISADNNTLSGIAASSFVLSNSSGNIDGSASQKAIPSGIVVGTTDSQTLTNKTLTNPTINGFTGDTSVINVGSGQIYKDTSGNVGIGTASPAFAASRNGLVVKGNTTNGGEVIIQTSVDTGSTGLAIAKVGVDAAIANRSNGALGFSTNDIERMRIDASGRITTPYQPAFLATSSSGGFPTVALGSYFTFNTISTFYSNANQSIGFNTSNYYYTAPVSGTYTFYCQMYMVNSGDTVAWFKNGSQVSFGDAAITFISTTTGRIFNGSIMLNLAAGDYVGLQPRAGTSSVQWYPGHSCFFGYLIG